MFVDPALLPAVAVTINRTYEYADGVVVMENEVSVLSVYCVWDMPVLWSTINHVDPLLEPTTT
jgi:hypothetical protein